MTSGGQLEETGKITYSVRELLADIRTAVANIDAKLDNKAEKVIVDNLEKRVSAIEVARNSEREYGTQLLVDYRELLKEHAQVKLDINSLQQNKKDKEVFNAIWIPVIVSIILSAVAIGSRFIH